MLTEDYKVKKLFPCSLGQDDIIDWGLQAIGAPEAWKKTKGKGIKVAVLDTGVDSDHPDLIDNIKAVKDFTGSRYGVEDIQGHGSHCAGVIAASDNGIGMIGVAPEAELYIGKVLDDKGNGSYDAIMRGIKWAMMNEVDVISLSLGSADEPPQALRMLIDQAYQQGIIIVAATGNENGEICYPAAYPNVIAVSAVNQSLQRADFSNYGIENEITAPGVDILSTYKDGGYARLSGTSMATPIIAGAVALIISRHKELFFDIKPSVEKIHDILLKMTKDLGIEGKDELYGAGIIDLSVLP